MTSLRIHRDVGSEPRARTSHVVRKALLATGAVSSVLYALLDLFAGLRYEGYSFYSQTISELGAIGAPQPAYLTPLFLTYTALVVVFAIAVVREGMRDDSRLRSVGALLLLYMLVGSGTAFFPVHVRGTAVFADEFPHIVSGLSAIVVMLSAMSVGARTLGRRFRNFTWSMMATLVAFRVLTVPFGIRLAAGEPTPGMGVTERIAYYSMLAWIAGLSVALQRRMRTIESGGRP